MLQPSLSKYAKYLEETSDRKLIEHACGWISYEAYDGCYFIADLWVDPDFRNKGVGSKLVEQVAMKAREAGVNKLASTVQINSKILNESLAANIHYGFKVVGADEREIKLIKEI